MVKRTALSTLERIAGPLRARGRTHLLAGYVHTAYPKVYALLAREAGFNSALFVRGVEGSVAPSLRKPGRAWGYSDADELKSYEVTPDEAGIDQEFRSLPLSESSDSPSDAAAGAARAGVAALEGARGPARDTLIYTAALCLRHAGFESSLAAAATRVRIAVDSGEARRRLEVARSGQERHVAAGGIASAMAGGQ